MTTIQKLKLHGFKSFAKPIEIPFEKNFSVILGANGSGKSNLSDAICFVLGKLSSKTLRAEKSSHLIYNGGKKGNPSKYAEVSIFFDNSNNEFPIDSKEVKITRIVKQSGNSIYKINDELRTRQQIVDLLAAAEIDPDGHNVVLQGDIVKFMEMKTEDRRLIIEDIAGISVYEDKKVKALQELEKVQQKLTEAEIILTEREVNLRELKKDYEQAKKYKDLESKIKDNKATFISFQLKGKETDLEDIGKTLSSLQAKVSSFNNRITELRSSIDQKREEIKNINIEIEEKGEKEQLLLRNEIDELKIAIVKNNSRTETLKTEINKIEERKSQLKINIQTNEEEVKNIKLKKKELEDQLKQITSEENSILREINSFKQKHNIQDFGDLKSKIDEIEDKIDEESNSLLKFNEEKQDLIRKSDKLEFQIQNLDNELMKIRDLESENKEKSSQLTGLRQDFKKTTTELSQYLNEDTIFSAQLSKARKSLIENNEELARLRAREIGIKEHLSQDFAIKKIKSLKEKGIFGTVAELGTVPTKFSLALEVAAGHRINSIVVQDDEIASKCIRILKETRSGIATFLPLNKIKPRIPASTKDFPKKGVHGLGTELIKFDKRFSNVFDYVFGSTLVVEDIETARLIGIGRIRMVTLEGDLLEPSGAMIGGYRRQRGIGFSQEEVSQKIKELEPEVTRLSSIVSTLESKKLENEERIISLKQEKADLEAEIIRTEKSIGIQLDPTSLKNDINSMSQELKSFYSKTKEINSIIEAKIKDLEKLKKEKDVLTSKLTQRPGLNKELSSLEEKRSSIRDKSFELKSELNNIANQIEKIYIPEIEKTNKIIKDQDKEYIQFKTELNDLIQIAKNKENELKQKEKTEKESYGKFKSLAIRRNKLSEEIQKTEQQSLEEQEKTKNQELKINEVSIKRASLVAELEGLNKEFEQYKDGKIRRGISIDELKNEIKEFEKIIANLGNVNLRALEIYENIEKEHQELISKTNKLKLEKDDVHKMINEIEEKKKDIFLKTFNEINTTFREIFNSLSTKGEAYLEPENKEDPLSEGIDIKVRIVGNKFLDIKSLSGGEKTLTALAFIFAIQEFNPASFYLLDEVDAALDKQNSELLSKLIAKYSGKAQYIVISHNDALISEANQIYGVSMQDSVSKIVSLKI